MVNSNIESKILQCKSSDVDSKISALTQLQQYFETSSEISDVDEIINVLKSCLRVTHQHLTTLVLSILPLFFRLLFSSPSDQTKLPAEIHILKQLLSALLSPAGIIDRLGDSRERAREKARESLVILGSHAFCLNVPTSHLSTRSKDSGKGSESPLSIWEGYFRENALQSKVWRVREQAILTLIELRRKHASFPLRPYMSLLVDTLEDTDGTVRECAKISIVELFRGPGVTDAARAGLKKEMTKKNVRKTIVDSVLQKLFAPIPTGTPHSEGSENDATAKKEYLPPSLSLLNKRHPTTTAVSAMSRATSQSSLGENTSRPSSRMAGEALPSVPTEGADIKVIYIASSRDLENEFAQMMKHFEGKETEHNWASRELSIVKLRGILKGDVYSRYPEAFLSGLKNGMIDGVLKALASLRTTLSMHACSFCSELTISLGTALDPFCETLLTHFVRLSGFTKKILAAQSQTVVDTIISRTSAHPKLVLNIICPYLQEKNVQSRGYALAHLKHYLEVHGQKSKQSIEAVGGSDMLDKAIRKGLGDANPAARDTARALFWVFESFWSEKGAAILASLDLTTRKQLDKFCPDPGSRTSVSSTETPKAKKSSVAAAIAASRIKAKAIALDPPTLRHQATSTSHAMYAAMASSRSQRSSSPTLSSKSVPGSRVSPPAPRSLSPASPTRRVLSAGAKQSVLSQRPSGPTAVSHQRSLSAGYSPPPSPLNDVYKKRHLVSQVGKAASNNNGISSIPSPPRSNRNGSSFSYQSQSDDLLSTSLDETLHPRSSLLSLRPGKEDESLLMAATIPIPEDSESEDDTNMLSSYSATLDLYRSQSDAGYPSESARSPLSVFSQPIVEDALRARAEQAESTAERLLELVEPDYDTHISPIPPALLPTNGNLILTTKSISRPIPSTPMNKKSSVLRQAAMFQNSPARNGSSNSLLDVLNERKHESGWWAKRMALNNEANVPDEINSLEALSRYIADLLNETADVDTLKKIAQLCTLNPFQDDEFQSQSFPSMPSPVSVRNISRQSFSANIWSKDPKDFARLFEALLQFLTPEKSEEILEYGLIIIWEMVENQASLLEGRERDIFDLLLRVRYCNRITVLEATNSLRDAVVQKTEAVYGLTTLYTCLRTFSSDSLPAAALAEWKSSSYAFGLIALGKFILRLPAEVLEEELPRLKTILINALNDSSSLIVRESAATAIIASQLVLRDESQLFALLDGLADEKKNLLTYLFDKHGARGNMSANIPITSEKLEKEMRRLDGRTNTSPRSKIQS